MQWRYRLWMSGEDSTFLEIKGIKKGSSFGLDYV